MTELNAEKVKALLEGISPAPWMARINDEDQLSVDDAIGEMVHYGGDMENTERQDHRDAELIAAAPDIARAYLALHERLERAEALAKRWRQEAREVSPDMGVVVLGCAKELSAALAAAQERDA